MQGQIVYHVNTNVTNTWQFLCITDPGQDGELRGREGRQAALLLL